MCYCWVILVWIDTIQDKLIYIFLKSHEQEICRACINREEHRTIKSTNLKTKKTMDLNNELLYMHTLITTQQ